jgi:hypothetical protein
MKIVLGSWVFSGALFSSDTIAYPSRWDALLSKRADPVYTDGDEFKWIQRFTAIGDSFSAGIDAGSVTHDSDSVACSKYDGAYPLKMQSFIKAPFFKHIACTGAVISDMIEKQNPQTGYGQDLTTISAGGNDVGFSEVLKACIFRPQGVCLSISGSTSTNAISARQV